MEEGRLRKRLSVRQLEAVARVAADPGRDWRLHEFHGATLRRLCLDGVLRCDAMGRLVPMDEPDREKAFRVRLTPAGRRLAAELSRG